ncbi:hypothetical protein RRG08_009890 [Elysia crispata]|uniref:MULE transposase domain-containing protein n=1 Tax=Elysia crispata TaxID=231223 RepID=A0AAE0Z492_9GAST|nr:hypothetical protein RRG08_009890 [Elysia crispata]
MSQKTIQRHQVRGAVKRKAEESVHERPLKMACTEVQCYDSLEFNDAKMLRQSIYRARKKVMPNLPRSLTETCEILQGHQSSILFNINSASSIIMFATPETVRFLCSTKHVYADGTFYTCPRYFYQLYTFFALNNGMYVPCVFFLLPDKTKQTYEQMLRMLLESFESSTSSLSIETIHIDQEAAMAEAVRNTSNFVIKFCHFHIRQSWLRKIQTLGLITDYKNEESDIGNWLKLFFGLPALSHEEVDDVFAFCLMVTQPESEKCEAFADYIFNNYISTSAPFQPPAWTNQEVEGRTTNACEAFHKNFKQSFISSKPNIFLFMQNLAHEISKATLKMKTPVATKRKADRDIEKNRLELINMYKEGYLTTERFLKKFSYKMLPVLDLH